MSAVARYLDVDPHEDLENESPIHGVADAMDATAEEACAAAQAKCPVLKDWDVHSAGTGGGS